jgi:predicted dehydrogenase
MRVGWTDSRYRLRSSPEWTAFGSGYNKLLAFRRQVENFCLAVRGAERLQIDSADVLASVQVIEAAYRSARRGGWVGVAGAEGSLQLREQLAGRA